METETRSVVEVIVRTVATQLFCTACYGHFLSLTNTPGRIQAVLVLAFVGCPFIAVGQLCYGVIELYHYMVGPTRSISLSSPVLDYWAYLLLNHRVPTVAKPEHTVHLKQAAHLLRSRKGPFLTWARCGRVVICLAALAQAIGSTILGHRRRRSTHLMTGFDTICFSASVCTVPVLLQTMLALCCPTRLETKDLINSADFHCSIRVELRRQLPSYVSIGIMLKVIFDAHYYHRGTAPLFWTDGGHYFWGQTIITICLIAPMLAFAVEAREWFENQGNDLRWTAMGIYAWYAVIASIILLLLHDLLRHLVSGIVVLVRHGGGWKDPLADTLFTI